MIPKWIFYIFATTFVFLFGFFAQIQYDPTSFRPYKASYNKSCIIPHLNPYDPTILSYISPSPTLKCSFVQYEITYLDDEGWLRINTSQVKELGQHVKCSYRCYDRIEGDDRALNHTDWIHFEEYIQPKCEFIETRCVRKSFPHNTLYGNNHNQILPHFTPSSSSSLIFKPSVILIVLDSVSHSNWIRSLPKSLEALENIYKSFIFDGMSKIGDNSFPNAVAFLSGKRANGEYGETSSYFDEHYLIWKDYKTENYTTFYAEDHPHFNLFAYLAKGFKKKPVDHYFRPFWLNVYDSYIHRRSTNLCYGNKKMHNIQLNYLSQFIKKYNGSARFALNWLTELGHDYMNTVGVVDTDLSTFLFDHYQSLKDSFVFVLSDHGHRFDAIRQTNIGRLEERLPFFSMHLPNVLYQQNPQLVKTINKNTKVLTTFWDFFQTMRDILKLTKDQKWEDLKNPQVLPNEPNQRGSSLLRPIKNRSCYESDVPEEFCVCKGETAMDVNNTKALRCASQLVNHINSILQPYPQCSSLNLSHIHSAGYSDDMTSIRYRISIQVNPSRAVFEGLLSLDDQNRATVIGEVNRINKYGNSSYCVEEQKLRKLCYCK